MAESVHTIVVPLDESALSESALPIADELAGAVGASVLVLTSGWGSTAEALDEYLGSRAARLTAPTETQVVPDTFPATAIGDVAERTDALIVMATHGRSGLGRALLGSVSEDVLKRTARPVVLVGPHAGDPVRLAGGIMAVTTDGSPASAMILPRAAAIATALGMGVRIVSVSAAGGTPLGGSDRDAVDRAMESSVAFLRQEGVEASAEPLVGADAAMVIAEWAGRTGVALLAMSTHGRSGVARTALGSTTMRAVHDSPCPVLVQRAVV